jgi:cobaltochelatase CobS
MSRTPSMSVAEAESALGPRGTITVTPDNKLTVRKWLTANGVPGMYAAGLAKMALQAAYNDSSNSALDRLRRDAIAAAQDAKEDLAALANGDENAVTNGYLHANGLAANNNPKINGNADALATVRDILLQGYKPQVTIDESTVRAIVADAIGNMSTRVIEIRAEHKPAIKIDGIAHPLFESVLLCLSQNVPVALIGPAGSGKTTCAEMTAKALAAGFYMNGAISGTHEYLGFVDAGGTYHSTPFRQAFEHGGIYCADEIDAGDPAAILVINSALANGHMPFPDQVEPVKKHPDFRIVACANTFGLGADRVYVGRNQLDGATLDRFATFMWDYDANLERALCGAELLPVTAKPQHRTMTGPQWCERVQALRAAAAAEKARIIISPRASIYGARLLAAGMSMDIVEQILVWKGTDSALVSRIKARVS